MAKLAANFMLIDITRAMTEAAAVLRLQGVDAGRLFSVMGETIVAIFQGYAARTAQPVPAAPGALDIPIKDIGYFIAAAQGQDMNPPLAQSIISDLQKMAATQQSSG